MMTRAKELRIGNIIFDDDGAIAKIIGFKPYEHSVRCDEEEGCDLLIDIYGADGKIRRGYAIDSPECNPIPLTPEWLERCGFEDGWLKFNGGDNLTVHKDGTAMVSGWDSATSGQSVEVPCKYLHQLQNFYFALTGEELNVKL